MRFRILSQQDKLVAALTKAQKKRKQRGAKQQPMADLHLGGHCAPYYPKNKPAGKGKHVQDHLVLQPGGIQYVSQPVAKESESKGLAQHHPTH